MKVADSSAVSFCTISWFAQNSSVRVFIVLTAEAETTLFRDLAMVSIRFITRSHGSASVVRTTMKLNGKGGNLTPRSPKTP